MQNRSTQINSRSQENNLTTQNEVPSDQSLPLQRVTVVQPPVANSTTVRIQRRFAVNPVQLAQQLRALETMDVATPMSPPEENVLNNTDDAANELNVNEENAANIRPRP